MNTHTTHKISKAEREFHGIIDSLKSSDIKTTITEYGEDVLGARTVVIAQASSSTITACVAITLQRAGGKCGKRTSLRGSGSVWYHIPKKKSTVNLADGLYWVRALHNE
jgi:hypothetical protein